MFSFPEKYKVVLLNSTAANAVSCDVVSCKNAHKVWFLISHTGTNDTDLTLTLTEYTAVGGSSSTVTTTCPIWENSTAGTSDDTWTKITDAAAVVIDPATDTQYLGLIEWDPAKHTAGYDCITLADSGGNASNTCVILAIIEERYAQAEPPSAIVD